MKAMAWLPGRALTETLSKYTKSFAVNEFVLNLRYVVVVVATKFILIVPDTAKFEYNVEPPSAVPKSTAPVPELPLLCVTVKT